MNKFLKALSLFMLIIFGAISSVLILSKMLSRSQIFLDLRDDEHSIILGHSHSECAYNDEFLPHVKNVSKSRESYFYTYLKLRALLKRNSQVDNVFLEFTDNNISSSMDNWIHSDLEMNSRLVQYFPLMSFDEYEVLLKNNPFGFSRAVPRIIKRNLGYIKNQNNLIDDFGGWYQLNHEYKPLKSANQQKELTGISELNLFYLEKIINLCDEKGVLLVLIKSPVHNSYLGNSEFEKVRSERFSEVRFLDFSEFDLSDHEMADTQHLNRNGAERYSKWFNDFLNFGELQQVAVDSFIIKENQRLNKLNSIIE